MAAVAVTVLYGKVGRLRGYFNQILMTVLINVPTVSFGLAMGWVSGASSSCVGAGTGTGAGALVWAAAGTSLAALAGMPLCSRCLRFGRKPTVIATSAAFALCWGLKLAGGVGEAGGCGGGGGWWWVCAARGAAGLGTAGAWTTASLYVKEVAGEELRGALAASVVLAQNLGYLLMYIAIDTLSQRMILWMCLYMSLCHCCVFALAPESPAFLAANNQQKRAREVLSWLRGVPETSPALEAELAAAAGAAAATRAKGAVSTLHTAKLILRPGARRKAVAICAVTVLGQEMCGVFALLHYAEQVFAQVSPAPPPVALGHNATGAAGAESLFTPSRQAVLLGAVQLVASVVALYLVERLGRKPLLVTCALTVSAGMCVAALCSWRAGAGGGAGGGAGAGRWVAAAALYAAIAADSAGLQPVPYVIMAEMFHYQYRSCVVTWVIGVACVANALELVLFPALAAYCGLHASLFLAALATLLYALYVSAALVETKDKTPEQIYQLLDPTGDPAPALLQPSEHYYVERHLETNSDSEHCECLC